MKNTLAGMLIGLALATSVHAQTQTPPSLPQASVPAAANTPAPGAMAAPTTSTTNSAMQSWINEIRTIKRLPDNAETTRLLTEAYNQMNGQTGTGAAAAGGGNRAARSRVAGRRRNPGTRRAGQRTGQGAARRPGATAAAPAGGSDDDIIRRKKEAAVAEEGAPTPGNGATTGATPTAPGTAGAAAPAAAPAAATPGAPLSGNAE